MKTLEAVLIVSVASLMAGMIVANVIHILTTWVRLPL